MQNYKAIALFSGGLDSLITVKWMQHLGYEILPVFFYAPYFPKDKAVASAEATGINLIVKDITSKHIIMLQNPKYGYGRYFNPCIDCHAMMIWFAGEMLEEMHADFIVTGEVIGQRPMSQRRDSMAQVAKLSEYGDLVVRPLCQPLLPDTKPIREGWVDNSQMHRIHGRQRNIQMELAEKLGIDHYPPPGGGCQLTNHNYALRIKDLLDHHDISKESIELLRLGRHFRISKDTKLTIFRTHEEIIAANTILPDSYYLYCRDYLGPWGIYFGDIANHEEVELAANIVLSYTNKAIEQCDVVLHKNDEHVMTLAAHKMDRREFRHMLISTDKE